MPCVRPRGAPAREGIDNVGVFSDPERRPRKATEITPEGHALVIDCRGDTRAVCSGQIHVTRLMKHGIAGSMGDSGIRDAGQIGDDNVRLKLRSKRSA